MPIILRAERPAKAPEPASGAAAHEAPMEALDKLTSWVRGVETTRKETGELLELLRKNLAAGPQAEAGDGESEETLDRLSRAQVRQDAMLSEILKMLSSIVSSAKSDWVGKVESRDIDGRILDFKLKPL